MKNYIILILVSWIGIANSDELRENFDRRKRNEFAEELLQSKKVDIVVGQGAEGSNALKVYYKGFEHGSKRVVASQLLDQSYDTATLEFKVKFCDVFNFTKGGKLHGLGPLHPITGGKPITPTGWSARLMFTQGGGLMTYVYHQDMKGKFGDTRKAENFRFEPNKYYQIKMMVRMNSLPDIADGKVVVNVNGENLISHEKIRFRSVVNNDSSINKFLFSTFHGGSTKEWAPVDGEGNYATECAYFDDFIVKNNLGK